MQRQPPPLSVLPSNAPPLVSVLTTHGVLVAIDVRLVEWPDGQFWQVRSSAESIPRYFGTRDGRELADGDQRYAAFLARHFLSDQLSPITKMSRVAVFGGEYPYVNRLLPVYRVQFDREDGMRIYVDTASSQLGTLVDDRKAVFNRLFTTLHTWRLGAEHDGVRVPVALVFLTAILCTPVLGILIDLARRGTLRAGGLRRLHRRLGLAVALVIICSAASGGYHLVKGALDRQQASPGPVWENTLHSIANLDAQRIAHRSIELQSLKIAHAQDRWFARAVSREAAGSAAEPQHGTHAAHHEPGVAAAPAPLYTLLEGNASDQFSDEDYARSLAAHFTGYTPVQFQRVELIGAFNDEYGFVNKLLPVYRVHAQSGERLYLHLDTATLAARIGTADLIEGWIFANLHKWHALEGVIGRWPRDLVQMGFALTSATVALLGLVLLRR